MTHGISTAFTPAELQYYEQITFRNMVEFYRTVLSQLVHNTDGKAQLTKGDRRVLRRLGIVHVKGTGQGRRLIVTSKARQMLGF